MYIKQQQQLNGEKTDLFFLHSNIKRCVLLYLFILLFVTQTKRVAIALKTN